MGKGSGKQRRVKSSSKLTPKAERLLAFIFKQEIPQDAKKLLKEWAVQLSVNKDKWRDWEAGMLMYTLTYFAEKDNKPVFSYSPVKAREVLRENAEENWPFSPLGHTGPDIIPYMVEQYGKRTKYTPTQKEMRRYQNAAKRLSTLTGKKNTYKYPVYLIPKYSRNPFIRLLQWEMSHPAPYYATVNKNKDLYCQKPIVISSDAIGGARNYSLSEILTHESIHIAHKHNLWSDKLGRCIIEGCADTLTFLAYGNDQFLRKPNEEVEYYSPERKFIMAVALTRPCSNRKEFAQNISALSEAFGGVIEIKNEGSRILAQYTGLVGVDWKTVYEECASNDKYGVDSIRDTLIQRAFSGSPDKKNLSSLEKVTK